ncbi:hypothetical protein N7468_001179 [Penicillium chermesinum]|uniref:Uncharacterized protein n=1 Tax=Penicillium chermesinum TaxID=63820 RepID=A0A9W9PG62_9EURO|nr:uncharacterized protein N7468_001179 [Penicillium chermesinum]KAJ5246196.1 hypothetical protein N7468_001179 [Penicillium chermesinum]KAJ6144482.1 hypothetical protein N7470_008377 [Penicillium chermesinum]
MSLYTAAESKASLIIDADISYIRGDPLYVTGSHNAQDLQLEISIADADLQLQRSVPINSSSNEIEFSLRHLSPRLEPYLVTLKATRGDARTVYSATTQLHHLPSRTDGGSTTKLDSLFGGLLVQNSDSSTWRPLFPYSYYASWDSFANSTANVQSFKDQGYNIIHIVPDTGPVAHAFNLTQLNAFLDKCDEIGLWVMWDMRWTYKDLSLVHEQLSLLKSRKSLLLWYTGDEPDGPGDPLNATKLAYSAIKAVDPWHPVSLALNCFNFYFEEYSSGADIVLSDVYPIAVNTSWSAEYNTPCNTTYGCCGCDDCRGEMEDISVRLDAFAAYQEWLGMEPKALWGVPMAFGDAEFWTRKPTGAEEVSMTMLSLNHNAKGIVMWDWPTSAELAATTHDLSRVLVGDEIVRFVLGAHTLPLSVQGHSKIDAAGWKVGDEVLVSILSLQTPDWDDVVTVELPRGAKVVLKVVLGKGEWKLVDGHLVKKGGHGLETDLLIVELGG